MDSLPTVVDEAEFDQQSMDSYLNRVFVHQLSWVNTPTKVLRKSIIDYYRAVTQSAVERDVRSEGRGGFTCLRA